MATKKLHKLHIDDEIWKYYIKGDGHGNPRSIIVFSPKGNRLVFNMTDFLMFNKKLSKEEAKKWIDSECYPAQIEPSEVKEFIIKKIYAKELL